MSDNDEYQIAAFSDLVSANRSRVFGYIYAMLHNMSDAEDIYQQTTVLMWEKFGEFQPGTDFASWALRIAYYNIKNFQRSQGRSRVFFSDSVMEKVAASYRSADEAQSTDRTDALVSCLKQLTDKHRRLLQLRYADNTPMSQLAELEDKSEAAVSMVLSRLRKSLLGCIQTQLAKGS